MQQRATYVYDHKHTLVFHSHDPHVLMHSCTLSACTRECDTAKDCKQRARFGGDLGSSDGLPDSIRSVACPAHQPPRTAH